MYACLHSRNPAHGSELLAIAEAFSPAVEHTSIDTVVFCITPLRKLMGSPHQIASEICRRGYERKIQANLAIAANIDTAILLAHNITGVILVTPGEEHLNLAPIPLSALLTHIDAEAAAVLQIFHRWGLQTCADLAALPEKGIAERLGATGVHLQRLACGAIDRPLRIPKPETCYAQHLDLDHPVTTLEPLLFVFARVLNDLCLQLQSQGRAARVLEATLDLDGKKQYRCALEFPVPLTDPASMLKLLQLHLEAHGPNAAVLGFTLNIDPAALRRLQGGLFVPPAPAPDKLQITLARIADMVGKENVGTPAMLNTHRPDAFEMQAAPIPGTHGTPTPHSDVLRLAIRVFRPALDARVTVANNAPRHVRASGVNGNVTECAGPWKTSGEWWTSTAWVREEWDVALDDGGLYRIFLKPQSSAWFIAAVYD